MTDKITREEFVILQADFLAIRAVVARLVSYEAARWPDPTKIFESFSDSIGQQIHEVTADRQPTAKTIAVQEEIQKQVDWIVASARTMAAGEGGT